MKINLFTLGVVLLLCLFTSCEGENVQPQIVSTLKSVEYSSTSAGQNRLIESYNVKYEGDKIVQFGNSTYSYGANDKVDKEVYTIGLNNPDHVTGTAQGKITVQYRWDTQGRLIGQSVVENTEINPASIFRMFPVHEYSYIGNTSLLNKIEVYNVDEKLVKSTQLNYIGEKLNSIKEDYYYSTSSGQYPNPFSFINSSPTQTYNKVLSLNPNPFTTLFNSLGFVPRDLRISYLNNVLLPYFITGMGVDSSSSTFDINIDSQNRLNTVKFSSSRSIDSLSTFYGSAEYRFQY